MSFFTSLSDDLTALTGTRYRDADARLVWYIAPRQRRIYAYTSATEFIVYREDATISAAPLLPDFQFALADLFS